MLCRIFACFQTLVSMECKRTNRRLDKSCNVPWELFNVKHILTLKHNPHSLFHVTFVKFAFFLLFVCMQPFVNFAFYHSKNLFFNAIIISISLTKISRANWNLQSFRRFFALRMSDLIILNGKFKLVNEHMRSIELLIFFHVTFCWVLLRSLNQNGKNGKN